MGNINTQNQLQSSEQRQVILKHKGGHTLLAKISNLFDGMSSQITFWLIIAIGVLAVVGLLTKAIRSSDAVARQLKESTEDLSTAVEHLTESIGGLVGAIVRLTGQVVLLSIVIGLLIFVARLLAAIVERLVD